MPELQFPDVVGRYQRGYEYGRGLAEDRRKQEAQSRLSQLASQAYGAAPDQQRALVGEAIGVNPEAGFALGQNLSADEEMRQKALLSSARLLQSAPAESRPALYQRIRPQLSQYLPDLPPEYGPQVEEGTRAYVAAFGGGQPDAKVVGNALVDSSGRVIYQAPQRFQTDQGLIEVGPEGAREIRLGVGQPQQFTGADGMPVNIGADVDPAVAAQIRANEGQFATMGDVPPFSADVSGRILPAGATERQRRLALAEESARRQEEAAARAAAAAERGAEIAERSARTSLVQGEQALRKEVSDMIKDPRTILRAYDQIRTVAASPSAANDRALIFSYMKMLDPGSVVREGEFANAQNAAGVPDRVINVYNNALRGEILNDQQRQQFAQSAAQIAESAQRQIDAVAREYYDIASAYGFDPRRATGLEAPGGGNIPRPQTQADFDALPSGATYIDPDDGRTYRKP